MTDIVAAADKEGDDGDRVGDIEEDDAGSDHAVGKEARLVVSFESLGGERGKGSGVLFVLPF